MGLLRWFSRPFSFKAVNPVMDGDHAEHFHRLSQIFDELELGSGDPSSVEGKRVLASINRLIDEARVHFEREQELMDSYGYAGRDSHCADHKALLKGAEAIYMRLESGDTPINNGAAVYFKGWLTKHMKTQDRWLEDFLRSARPVGKISRVIVGTGHQ